MPNKHALSYRQINNLHRPPSDLSRAIASILRDILGVLALGFAILMPVLVAGLLNA